MNIFFELHRDIPREGPGDNASTRKAFSMLTGLPARPRLLDVGCGPGKQTIELARISSGNILAIDTHQPFLDVLTEKAEKEGLTGNITCLNKSMLELNFESGSFDVIWSEGAIYIIGFEKGLREWQPFLKKGGYLAASELSWLKPDPPAEIKAFWDEGYPGMKAQEENLEIVREAGYRLVGHFVLPESSWWDEYYTPLEKRIPILSEKYRDDEEAMALLRGSQQESDLYRKYSDWYGYVFYVMQV
jgi:ubiquinone/menaquinone biosynthesis C-methylase UbiE